MQKNKLALRLTESAIMIAAATILSMFKLVELPYGGSITLASMLPIVIIAYRYGTAWGILCGLVHGAIQLLLGSGTLSYVTGAASVVAVILLDYIVAFAVCGLAGIFRNMKKQSTGLLSGFTDWRDISVPAADAVIYSFIYNATYMLPEMIVLALSAYYIGSSLDFRQPRLAPIKKENVEENTKSRVLAAITGAVALAAAVFDVAAVFAHLQNADSGEFDITGISAAPWGLIIVISASAIAVCAVLLAVRSISGRKKDA
mgnify:CR=1 FL=1